MQPHGVIAAVNGRNITRASFFTREQNEQHCTAAHVTCAPEHTICATCAPELRFDQLTWTPPHPGLLDPKLLRLKSHNTKKSISLSEAARCDSVTAEVLFANSWASVAVLAKFMRLHLPSEPFCQSSGQRVDCTAYTDLDMYQVALRPFPNRPSDTEQQLDSHCQHKRWAPG
ncbi:hypothetical protein AAFF_G00127220 [Aldrovandia affinis]|uniref:Uncharacterized protein n=1 Tax=Aldrovandia affinis TaxID=143900 RepID=A0AAD7T2T8_9TELE|nr:hypothetical protein AAFF_G00127220 [Aldrovandia affinis]